LFSHAGSTINFSVHARLGETRFITFVVSPSAECVKVDHDIPLEFLSKIHSQGNHLSNCFGIFAIDMENGDLQHLCDVGSVGCAASLFRLSGEADLIINHDVQCAACLITLKFAEVQCFLDHSLTCKRCITVDQDGHDLLSLFITAAILLASGTTLSDCIDEFEMAWIEAQ